MYNEAVEYFDVMSTQKYGQDLFSERNIADVANIQILSDIYHYYMTLIAKNAGLPAKGDIDLKPIRSYLGNIFLLELNSPLCPPECHYYYRVVGSKLSNIFGGEMSMKCLKDQKFTNQKDRLLSIIEQTRSEPNVHLFKGELVLKKYDKNSDASSVFGNIMLLPLSANGMVVDHILGAVILE